MQDEWRDVDQTQAGDPVIHGKPRDVAWEAPEVHAENIDEIERFLKDALGEDPANVLHEILSDKIHLDVLIYPPNDGRDYYLYVTSGMSDLPMHLPAELPQDEYGRAELIMALPRAWGDKLNGNEARKDEADRHFWPIGVMKWLARYPHIAGTWFGEGHTIPNPAGGPYEESTRLDGVMLIETTLLPPAMTRFRLPDGDILSFLGVVFLYPEEMDLKLEKGADEVIRRLSALGHPEKLDLSRRSVVRTNPILRMLKGV